MALFIGYVGTGACYGHDLGARWPHRVHNGTSVYSPPIGDAEPAPARLDVRSAKEHIENIRAVLDPAISDLAALFGITRQAIYKWINGTSSPEEENLQRVVELSTLADRFKAENVGRADQLLKLRIFSGQSLLDLVRQGAWTEQHTLLLIAEANAMRESYQRSGAVGSTTRPSEDWKSSVSIPAAPDLG
jgi:transcriptional regulator with XRE-family HTH domain